MTISVCNYQRGFDQLRLWSDLLLKEPRARAFIRPDDNGCWIWTGAKGNEYGQRQCRVRVSKNYWARKNGRAS